MSYSLYKHTKVRIQVELTALEYQSLSRENKKKYRQHAKKNNLPKIWNDEDQKHQH